MQRVGGRRGGGRGFGAGRDEQFGGGVGHLARAARQHGLHAAERRCAGSVAPDQAQEARATGRQWHLALHQRAAGRCQGQQLPAAHGAPLAQRVAAVDVEGGAEFRRARPGQAQRAGCGFVARSLAQVDEPAGCVQRHRAVAGEPAHADAIALHHELQRRRQRRTGGAPRQRVQRGRAQLLLGLDLVVARWQQREGHALAPGVDQAQVGQAALLAARVGARRQRQFDQGGGLRDVDRRAVAVARSVRCACRAECRAECSQREQGQGRQVKKFHGLSRSSARARRRR